MERYQKNNLKGLVTPEKAKTQAQTLASSVTKKFRHLQKRFRRENVDCFRLYDWDSPDIRIVVDWYAGHLVVAEYERKQTGPEYLPQMADAAAKALSVAPEKVHLKRRHTNVEVGLRYKKLGCQGERFKVNERDLKFWVNLTDFLDTGLYSDHRDTRVIIRKLAKGKDFLNLFAYTGAFTCAAAAGNVRSSVTVDRSETYLLWAKDNLILNGLWNDKHTLVQSDVDKYLAQAKSQGKRFTLVFVDPPSFFKDSLDRVEFDINRDHPRLLRNVLGIMAPGADLFFSTNHQRFEPCFDGLNVTQIIKLTPKTVPEDYRNKNIHSCWRMIVK